MRLSPQLLLFVFLGACSSRELSLGAGPNGLTGRDGPPPDVSDPNTGGGSSDGATVVDPNRGADADPCAGIAQCAFACPDGTVNPRDKNGCDHTCMCVLVENASAGPVALKMYTTCGDPLCSGYRGTSGVPPCGTTDTAGAACNIEGAQCDLKNACNQLLVCARQDPKARPGGCPISRRSFKRDIRYLALDELAPYEDELMRLKLATWRYKGDPARERLGFIIDDNEASVAVEETGDRVDLYGYTSLAVATLKRQAQQIAALEREVAALKRALTEKRRR